MRSSFQSKIAILALTLLIAAPFFAETEEGEGMQAGHRKELPPRSTSADEWSMYMGDRSHQGYSPTKIPLKNDTGILWGQRIDQLLAFTSPIVYGDVVYLGTGNGNMMGFDIDTGEEVFNINIGSYKIQSAAAVDNGIIYFGASNGHLYGFRISDKSKVTDVNLNGKDIFSSPLIVNGKAYIGVLGPSLNNHKFHAVDLSTNSINWTMTMDEEENFYGFKETAAYSNGKIYIGDGNGTFFCLDEDGFYDGNDGSYITEENTSLSNPDILWKWENPIAISTDAMVADGRVYFGIVTGDLYCLDAETGSQLWTKEVGRGERGFQSCPSYHNGRVYITARNYNNNMDGASVYCLDSVSGSQVWRFNITGQMITESSPVIVDDALLFGSRNRKLYCISTIEENIADEDRILWTNKTGFPITSTPAVAAGRVFIATEPLSTYGKLFAIGSPDPRIESVSISDPFPYEGERVKITANILNNATVDCRAMVEFKATTLNNSKQTVIGIIDDVYIENNVMTRVQVNWTVESGFDYFAVFIKNVTPRDSDLLNNFDSQDLSIKLPLKDGWTSSGAGPDRSGGRGESLESNRSFWEMNLSGPWRGDSEPIFYDQFGGNGTVSAAGAAIYFSDPEGRMTAYYSNPGQDSIPDLFWRYSNSSVAMVGRPVVLADRDQTFSGPNKIFSYGDDGAIWAFDWSGFKDGENDGPYLAETETDQSSGDIVWRTEIPYSPSRPLYVSGGNLIVTCSDGNIRGIDDDDGKILWTRSLAGESISLSDHRVIFIVNQNSVEVVDPNTGAVIRTMSAELPYDLDPRSALISNDLLVISGQNVTAIYDLYPDDGIDEGIKDNSSDSDLIWIKEFEGPMESPPAVSSMTGVMGLITDNRIWFHHLTNGTEMSNLTLSGPISGRIISGGGAFYLTTGTDPWTVRSYIPDESGDIVEGWTLDLYSKPRGELVIEGNHMYISLTNGKVMSIGAQNNPPTAVIAKPARDLMIFPDEMVELDATGSADIDEDPLTYVWSLEGMESSLYEGPDPITTVYLSGVGKKRLTLRVYDDMRAFDETYTEVVILKRITSPDFKDFLYDINVHMSYGISEASGRGLINVSIPVEPASKPGAMFICNMDFVTWPVYAMYRFEWANVTIGYSEKEFKDRLNEEKMGIFYLDGEDWKRAPESGVDTEEKKVWGNFSELRSGRYAIGILDNSPPELNHRETEDYRYRMIESTKYKFRVEYRDSDDNLPVNITLHIDNSTIFQLADEGFATSVTRWTFHSVSDIVLGPGSHSYYFEADDGNFIVRSPYYHINVANNPPVVSILGPTSIVRTGDIVLFDGSGSYDPDGDPITFSWDFDNRDGIQRDALDQKVDHVYLDEGNYIITLTVSDNVDQTSKTISITVLDEKSDTSAIEDLPPTIWVGIIVVMGILILAIIIFIVISRRGHEEQSDIQRKFEGRWTCPECDTRVPNGVEECPKCDYIYDPLDFDEEDPDDLEDFEDEDDLEEFDEEYEM
jgi:outer membrane protein assembly factor BamB